MIKSVQKSLKVLKLLSDYPSECVPLKVISANTGIEKSTCHHLLETLCAEGFVLNVDSAGKYTLGPEAYLLSRFGRYNESFVSVCHSPLAYLARKTEKTVLLAVFVNDRKFIIDKIDPSKYFFAHSAKIFTDDIYRTATGRILLSHLTRDELHGFFCKFGAPESKEWDGISSFEQLRDALTSIRQQPFVKTQRQVSDNLIHVGIGKAIFKGRKCVGAIGLAYSEITPSDTPALHQAELKLFLRTADEITRRLNFIKAH